MSKLTAKQSTFVLEYLIDYNATKAAIRAGYSKRTARSIGSENLTKPVIGAKILEAMKERSKRTEIEADRILAEYASVAFSDMRDYMTFSDDGNVYVDWTNMPKDVTKAIAEITQEEYAEGKGRRKKTSLKLHSKLGALNALAKHLGLFNDAVDELRAMVTNIENDTGSEK